MIKKIFSIFLVLTLVISFSDPKYAKEIKTISNIERAQTSEIPNAVGNLKSLSKGKLKFYEENGKVFLSGKLSQKETAGIKAATQFLEDNNQIFGINSAENELRIVGTKKDSNGDTFVKFNQVINGVPVKDNLLNVHFNKYGTIVSVNGKLQKNKSVTKLGNKYVSESEAVDIAKKQFYYKGLANSPKTIKTIFTEGDKNYEVFKVNIYYTEPTRGNWNVFVEISSGRVIKIENNIRYDGNVVGTGLDVSGNTRPLNLYQNGNSYQMTDLSNSATDYIDTYSANNTESYCTLVSNNTNTFNLEIHKASVSAHYNAGQVINFYKNLFNRNSLDNNNMSINSITHYSNNFNNAFWDGEEMVYGDGDGTTFTYLSGDLDVVGHEMTHGVISNSANLNYENQPGALNESIADVFGVLIETYSKYNVAHGGAWLFNPSDWVIGDEIYTPKIPGDALRSLSNPTLYNQPDKMSQYKNLPDDENGDWGGIHINSGIPNKAAYLISQSIGMEKTAKIYYRALVNYMTPTTDFEEARNLIVQSAADLYGENGEEVTAINNAFDSVGIGQPILSGIGNLESPTANATINGAINLSGWYLDKAGVKEIKVFVDGNEIGQATYGDYRPDISAAYPEYENNNSGFNYTLDTTTISNGTHLINVQVINYNGEVKDLGSRYVNISNIIAVTGITLDKTQSNLKVGEIVNLAATVTPANAVNKNVTWASNNSLIASVDNAGKVTAVGIGTAIITATTVDGGKTANCTVTVTAPIVNVPSVSYQGHVQNIGWQDYVKDGALAGTVGQALRVEAIRIKLEDAPAGLKIKYKAHVQNIGWQDWVYDGAIAGTQGKSLRVEALQIMLEGLDADKYSVQYQAHVQNEGWQQWVKDGQIAGTFGKSQRIEALRIKITKKLPSVSYQGHVQNIGWQDYVKDGALAGTVGQALRVEAIRIKLEDAPAGLKIKYKAHVQNIGWQDWVYDGAIAGTQGQSLRVEALQIMLEGPDADKYSVQYQAHVQNEGWQQWVKDGQIAGTFGKSQRIEALKIIITEK